MSGKRHKKGIWLDPRAKLFLILMQRQNSYCSSTPFECFENVQPGGCGGKPYNYQRWHP